MVSESRGTKRAAGVLWACLTTLARPVGLLATPAALIISNGEMNTHWPDTRIIGAAAPVASQVVSMGTLVWCGLSPMPLM